MKRIISLFLTSVLLSTTICNVNAENKMLLDYSKEEIATMSDAQYLDLYGNYYIDALEKKKTDSEIEKELSALGIEFKAAKTNETRASLSTDISLNVTFSRRAGQAYTYVTGVATPTTTLASPATEDCMSIEWEPSKGSYYGYAEGQNTTLKDYSKRNNGTLVFNVQDSKMTSKTKYALASALVIFNNNSNTGSIGIKYIHTYGSSAPSLTIGGNVGYTGGLVSGGVSIGLSINYTNATWQRAYLYS
ncbi:hypothetical protein [Thomasclavelia sp.]|uniref:hypothetical protein n=1 Tax=Thomasclavelia sp. TaxID=3025757 RepID=UPI0025DEFA45|nr:hypothetical protein [Thomasclavelia sp.]